MENTYDDLELVADSSSTSHGQRVTGSSVAVAAPVAVTDDRYDNGSAAGRTGLTPVTAGGGHTTVNASGDGNKNYYETLSNTAAGVSPPAPDVQYDAIWK